MRDGKGWGIGGCNDGVCFEMKEEKGVMEGKWKGVEVSGGDGEGCRWELYKVEREVGEENEVCEVYGEKVKEVMKVWKEYGKCVGYMGWEEWMRIKRIGGEGLYEYKE